MAASKVSEREVTRAIKALDKAYEALGPLTVLGPDDPRNGVSQLRGSIREYLEYLECATWWRSKPRGK